MGYLNNTGIVVDCILTRKGRELLARGSDHFKITHYALGDTEVDYGLWNADHPLGTAYYGIVIENMPVTEAVPDETQNLKHKLVTLPRKTNRIPIVSVPQTSYTLSPGQSVTITPQTINYTEGNSVFGYTFILADSDICSMYVDQAAPGQAYAGTGNMIAAPMSDMEIGSSLTLNGKSVVLTANLLQLAARSTTLTIIGNETGGRTVVNITVKKQTLNTTPNTPLTGNPPVSLP
jgi:hypothetical protein